ncbi:hypothetical protein POP72_012 [Pectobacterium phage POP72]|uniref:Uncharacterized protein n=2 Tax=Axomammavirus PP1 TaxID=2733578 RepID=I7EWA4_9CAUD|nr:hypothetical protein F486_gp10 [Pectobacterium phage PP1]AFP33673.1 hypothetical protein PP1_010 [Pectobacterium phage PP1]ARB10928.1 hypothetical protein POP72_012 [Pectobacterium phage POP72]
MARTYRIKTMTMQSGRVVHIPQYKWLCFWISLKEYTLYDEHVIQCKEMRDAKAYIQFDKERIARDTKKDTTYTEVH